MADPITGEAVTAAAHDEFRRTWSARLDTLLSRAALPVLNTTTDETAGLRAALDAVNHLHRELRLYGECGHRHTGAGNGVISVENVGLTCADGYERSICRECCTGGSDYQTEECAANHEHNCWPCRTHEAAVNAVAASLRGDQGE